MDISAESQYYHGYKNDDREPLEGLFEGIGHLGEESAGKDAQYQRNTQEDEDGLENLPKWNNQGGHLAGHACSVNINVTPKPEIERGHQHGKRGGNGCK